jgi:hypothetical protein
MGRRLCLSTEREDPHSLKSVSSAFIRGSTFFLPRLTL